MKVGVIDTNACDYAFDLKRNCESLFDSIDNFFMYCSDNDVERDVVDHLWDLSLYANKFKSLLYTDGYDIIIVKRGDSPET